MENEISEATLKRFGSKEGYAKELEKQRTREYKDKRNARVLRKKTKDKLEKELSEIIQEEISCKLKVDSLKEKRAGLIKRFTELAINGKQE